MSSIRRNRYPNYVTTFACCAVIVNAPRFKYLLHIPSRTQFRLPTFSYKYLQPGWNAMQQSAVLLHSRVTSAAVVFDDDRAPLFLDASTSTSTSTTHGTPPHRFLTMMLSVCLCLEACTWCGPTWSDSLSISDPVYSLGLSFGIVRSGKVF